MPRSIEQVVHDYKGGLTFFDRTGPRVQDCDAMSRLALVSVVSLAATVIAAASGCDKAPTPGSGAASASVSAPPPVSAPAPTPAQPAPPPPDDLDAAALLKALKCVADSKLGPCRVLAGFASCNKDWNPVSPSGDARWLGAGYVVENGKTTEIISIVRSKRVPTTEIAPGQLPVKIGIAELEKQEGAAYDQAGRAVRAFERGDQPPRSSPTLEYIKKRENWPESFASKTVGGQVYSITQGGTFVCQGKKQQLLVVQRSSSKASSGDGLYAELYPTSW